MSTFVITVVFPKNGNNFSLVTLFPDKITFRLSCLILYYINFSFVFFFRILEASSGLVSSDWQISFMKKFKFLMRQFALNLQTLEVMVTIAEPFFSCLQLDF